MKRRIVALIVALALLLGAPALAAGYHISDENEMNFGRLCIVLLRAYAMPSPDDGAAVQSVLEAIGAMDVGDRAVAEAIAEHWMRVYADAEGPYPLYVHDGGQRATALENTDIPDSATHAFVVLGYKLKNGAMTEELVRRCEAAAAAARSFPNAILICTGGATGSNNPARHTEAGLMKAYLTDRCGIDASRIFVEDRARNTADNARYSFEIMRAQSVSTYTVITSAYHQKRGQVLYNAMGAFCRQAVGYETRVLANYSCDVPTDVTEPDEVRQAMRQLVEMLDLPDEVVEGIKRAFK